MFGPQLLAGARINELTKHRQTALHLAAQQDLATICSVLLENGVDFAAEDENGNNGKGGGAARGGPGDTASPLSLLLSQLCIWPSCRGASTTSEPSSPSPTSTPRPSTSGTRPSSLWSRPRRRPAGQVRYQNSRLHVAPVSCVSRGHSPMHVLGHYGKENAAAIFELFLECMPEYPLDKPDNEGNTGARPLHYPRCYRCYYHGVITVVLLPRC